MQKMVFAELNCHVFFMTSPLWWLLACCLSKEVYLQFFKRPFDYTAVAGSGKVGPVNQVNHTSWVAVVTPTDRRSVTAV